MKDIPQEWIKNYVDNLIKAAKMFGDTPMGNAAVLRADHIMDMVEAFHEIMDN